jgi:hypothetical protein
MTDVARLWTLPAGLCWIDTNPDIEPDPVRWVVQATDGSVSTVPTPGARQSLNRALSLLTAQPHFQNAQPPQVQRAEVYEGRPAAAPGHLYLRVSGAAAEWGSWTGEFWVCTGPLPAIDWQGGVIVVGQPDRRFRTAAADPAQ